MTYKIERFKFLICLAIAFTLIGNNCQTVHAQDTHEWNDPNGGVYGFLGNWDPLGVPSALDTAVFDLNGQYNVSLIASRQVDSLEVLNSSEVTLESSGISGATRVFTTNRLSIDSLPAKLFLQPTDRKLKMIVDDRMEILGALSLFDGAEVECDEFTIGEPVATFGGNLTIDGIETTTITPSRMFANHLAVYLGGIDLSNGGTLFNRTAEIERGQVNIGGPLSNWITTERLDIGLRGLSSMDIFAGAKASSVNTVVGGSGGLGIVSLESNDPNHLSALVNSVDLTLGDQSSNGWGSLILKENSRATISGTLELDRGKVELNEDATLVADVIQVNNDSTFDFLGGTLVVNQFEGDIESTGGTVSPGDDGFAATLVIGDLTCDPNTKLAIGIGGTTGGSDYDVVQLFGEVLIDGDLELSVPNGFVPDPSDEFLVLAALSSFGNFDNVVNNQRLETVDGFGSFLVNYGISSPFNPNHVVLSDYQPNPGAGIVTPDSMTVIRGTHTAGTIVDLSESDDTDVSLRRANSDIQSRTQIELVSTSPMTIPASMRIVVEGSVFARTNISQKVELYNYDTNSWEEVDARNASRFIDQVADINVTGDVSRFVQSGTNEMKARLLFTSANPRQQFSSNTDQFNWIIGN